MRLTLLPLLLLKDHQQAVAGHRHQQHQVVVIKRPIILRIYFRLIQQKITLNYFLPQLIMPLTNITLLMDLPKETKDSE
ncbi:hypothetical protein COW57_00655 [Candidatus Roizmanbacteria bacterium CG17_big_fil_post_rev_8_21_14_2_50_39_7]|uniref:Uncharacterized protein n=1 Tax=Candidatus Roizmanbacteria bacterium CG17_big_fil_post_rev_8_21_14_2_50_39_7 TaxID=1974858 RepID=A0A2M7EKY5_9BACT|nr:MAG: hypothetical protein COW57_00655 [Candidatus Roizmanbacteria bacterium CG17_big_fil_post_rev_8_21_14_2_50_39_7]PJC80939.1 MAG: hypothetical protein CO008_00480 [Candidatus Roizmanbacteria bacterium CG_4_8_14_3_um_filter_36_12]